MILPEERLPKGLSSGIDLRENEEEKKAPSDQTEQGATETCYG